MDRGSSVPPHHRKGTREVERHHDGIWSIFTYTPCRKTRRWRAGAEKRSRSETNLTLCCMRPLAQRSTRDVRNAAIGFLDAQNQVRVAAPLQSGPDQIVHARAQISVAAQPSHRSLHLSGIFCASHERHACVLPPLVYKICRGLGIPPLGVLYASPPSPPRKPANPAVFGSIPEDCAVENISTQSPRTCR